ELPDVGRPPSGKAITKELPEGGRRPSNNIIRPDDTRPPIGKAVTKELPDSHRPPARRDSAELSQAEVMLNHSPTQDFAPRIDIGAPTRDLGLRPPSKRPGTLPNPVDEDAPTKQSDVRAIRDTARDGKASARQVGDATSNDIVLPFDPIDARAAQILDDV